MVNMVPDTLLCFLFCICVYLPRHELMEDRVDEYTMQGVTWAINNHLFGTLVHLSPSAVTHPCLVIFCK